MGKQIFKELLEAKNLGVKFGKYSVISLLHLVKNTVLFKNQFLPRIGTFAHYVQQRAKTGLFF